MRAKNLFWSKNREWPSLCLAVKNHDDIYSGVIMTEVIVSNKPKAGSVRALDANHYNYCTTSLHNVNNRQLAVTLYRPRLGRLVDHVTGKLHGLQDTLSASAAAAVESQCAPLTRSE